MAVKWMVAVIAIQLLDCSCIRSHRVTRTHRYGSYYDILYPTCTCDIDCPWRNKAHKVIDFNGLFHTEDQLKALSRLYCINQTCFYPNYTTTDTDPPEDPVTESPVDPTPSLSTVPFVSQSDPGVDGCRIFENSDGGRCCTTCWTYIRNETVFNPLTGQTRFVIHMDWLDPPVYQYIPIGRCGNPGQCQGLCIQELVTQYLLVAEQDPAINPSVPVFFEAVQLPAYCKCTGATALSDNIANIQDGGSSSTSSSTESVVAGSSSGSSDSSSTDSNNVDIFSGPTDAVGLTGALVTVGSGGTDDSEINSGIFNGPSLIPITNSTNGGLSLVDFGIEGEVAPLVDPDVEFPEGVTSTAAVTSADESEAMERRRRRRKRRRQSGHT